MTGPRSTWNAATRIYSTCRSGESAGYCDFNLPRCEGRFGRRPAGFTEEGVDGVRELLIEPRRGTGGGFAVGMPFRIEGFDGVRDEGKEESEPCRLRLLLAVPLLPPLVEGRYERTEVMIAVNAQQLRVSEITMARSKVEVCFN